MSIPHVIHQVWLGDQSRMPDKWMGQFQDAASEAGWKYLLWDEAAVASLTPLVAREQFEWLYENKIFYGCSDLIRYEVLYRMGGWYFDADCILLDFESFRNADYQGADFVVAKPVAEVIGRPGRLPNTVIGASRESPIMAQANRLVSLLDPSSQGLMPCWDKVGGTLMTKALDGLRLRDDSRTAILPAKVFYPFNIDDTPAPNEGGYATVVQHRWGTTYNRYEEGISKKAELPPAGLSALGVRTDQALKALQEMAKVWEKK